MSRRLTTGLGLLLAMSLVCSSCKLSDPPRKRAVSTKNESPSKDETPNDASESDAVAGAQAPVPQKLSPMTPKAASTRSRIGGPVMARPQLRIKKAQPNMRALQGKRLNPIGTGPKTAPIQRPDSIQPVPGIAQPVSPVDGGTVAGSPAPEATGEPAGETPPAADGPAAEGASTPEGTD